MTAISRQPAAVPVLHRHRPFLRLYFLQRLFHLPLFARLGIKIQTTVPPYNPTNATARARRIIVAVLVHAITPKFQVFPYLRSAI